MNMNKNQIRILRHTIALLSSMVKGGEVHSETSEAMVDEAFDTIDIIEKYVLQKCPKCGSPRIEKCKLGYDYFCKDCYNHYNK